MFEQRDMMRSCNEKASYFLNSESREYERKLSTTIVRLHQEAISLSHVAEPPSIFGLGMYKCQADRHRWPRDKVTVKHSTDVNDMMSLCFSATPEAKRYSNALRSSFICRHVCGDLLIRKSPLTALQTVRLRLDSNNVWALWGSYSVLRPDLSNVRSGLSHCAS